MDMTILIAALIMVESGGDPSAIGDDGKAAGILQQHPIFVDDVNRILGRRVYTYMDRNDVEQAVEMAKIWLTYYAGCFEQKYGYPVNYTEAALIYNRGWVGFQRMEVLDWGDDEYWLKTFKEILRIQKGE